MRPRILITPRGNLFYYKLEDPEGTQLIYAGNYLDAERPYLFGEPEFMTRGDHRKIALPLLHSNRQVWVLVEDMLLDIFEIQQIENLWNERLARERGEVSLESTYFFAWLQLYAGAPIN